MPGEETTTPPATGEETPPTNEGLGDGGKKALDSERTARKAAEKALRALEAKVKEFEDRDKSDADKAADALKAAEARAEKAESHALRLEVAAAKGLTPAQAKRLVGASKEELEADADEILEAFPAKPAADPKPEGEGGAGRPPSARPTADLRGGGDPTEVPDDMDPKKLAGFIPRP